MHNFHQGHSIIPSLAGDVTPRSITSSGVQDEKDGVERKEKVGLRRNEQICMWSLWKMAQIRRKFQSDFLCIWLHVLQQLLNQLIAFYSNPANLFSQLSIRLEKKTERPLPRPRTSQLVFGNGLMS